MIAAATYVYTHAKSVGMTIESNESNEVYLGEIRPGSPRVCWS